MVQAHSFGDWLKRSRKALDLTQAQLAKQVGCSAAAIRKIEAEERRPSAQIVEQLAELFLVAPAERPAFIRFARGDVRSAPTSQVDAAPWRTAPAPRSNLPALPTSLIGREAEIAAVREYLLDAGCRLVTLSGPPGIGKTRLSIESARAVLADFPDGVFFVALAPLGDATFVAPTVVQTLGFAETDRKTPLERLKDGIGNKQLLLVLDNLEHLVEGAAPLISELLLTCPRVKILTTSREALRISGEWLYSVPALELPAQAWSMDLDNLARVSALRLFAERARAVRSDFALNSDNLNAVADICSRLDGLPLAIELIAARIRLMSPQALLERLSRQFVLSADGVRAVSLRQKTLNNAIGWSYNLLSDEEKQLFARLSVFSGGFTLDAAESIFSRISTAKSVTDLITSLLDKSLLQRTLDERDEPRFSMLVTIQQFAWERLWDMQEQTQGRERHLAYFLALAEQADREIHGPDQVKWNRRLASEHNNLRAALECCVAEQKTESALRLLGALAWAWWSVRDQNSELRSWFEKIRALRGVADHPALYARLLNQIGGQSWLQGDFREARAILEESRTIWLGLGVDGERGLAEALYYLGLVAHLNEGNNKTARSLLEQSVELCQRHGDRWGTAFALLLLGNVEGLENENAKALALMEQSLELFRQLGDGWGIARASQRLGELHLFQGNFDKARSLFEEHLRIDTGLDFKQGTMVALQNLGHLNRMEGDYPQSEHLFNKSIALSQEYGLFDGGASLYGLGLLALQRYDYALAEKHFIANFDIERDKLDEKISAADLLMGMAAVAGGMEEPERAARLSGAAEAILDTTDFHFPKFDRAEFNRHIQLARTQLGDEVFEAMAAEGRAMTLQQAIAYALKEQQ